MAADETKDSAPTGVDAGAVGTTGDAPPPTQLPKGMILGKDGKPCRACNTKQTFMNFAAQAKSKKAAAIPVMRKDCPADVEILGRSTWTLLHSIAATYPTTPTPNEQNDLKSFMGLFAKLYPCWFCAEDFQRYIKKEEPRVSTRDEFGNWLCEAHNEVNKKLGKPTFDCSKWQERWRTGWKDGSCD
ncbi:ERV/ALR sulfhydryl oxidase domain-containing protein [Bombardia bombarda]|uniref:Sulfhydryl oxidase n=1 Tax=Bombardia bombarda TaxID=252184 RepID=A0AA39TKF2_9PEZI|nr:ERV/ALR sulfhydryl oxidase domain-containing protein [Bombardia bombarda]